MVTVEPDDVKNILKNETVDPPSAVGRCRLVRNRELPRLIGPEILVHVRINTGESLRLRRLAERNGVAMAIICLISHELFCRHATISAKGLDQMVHEFLAAIGNKKFGVIGLKISK